MRHRSKYALVGLNDALEFVRDWKPGMLDRVMFGSEKQTRYTLMFHHRGTDEWVPITSPDLKRVLRPAARKARAHELVDFPTD